MRFAIFPAHVSKILRLPRKIDARSNKVLHLSRKIILANLHIWYSKMQPLSGNQRPDLLTSLMNMSFVLRLPQKMHLCRSSSNVPTPAIVFGNATKPSRYAHFWRGAQSLAPTLRNDISTSKSGPYMVCFVHFDLQMCFAPQRRALFRHLNFQKWSGAGVLCTFWLGNVLRATTVCAFWTSQLPKVVREWCVLYIFTSKCASRHNGVQFFISPLASWLRTRRFSEPTFRPSGATNHWKNTVNRDFPTFSRISIFFLLTLSLLLFFLQIFFLLIFLFSLPLPISAFHLSILSEVWLLNFLRSLYHIVYSKTPVLLQMASNQSSDLEGNCTCCTCDETHVGEVRFEVQLWKAPELMFLVKWVSYQGARAFGWKQWFGRRVRGLKREQIQKKDKNKMQPTNPNAHTYVNGTDVKTHGYAVTQNTFLQKFIWTVLNIFPLLPVCSVERKVWSAEWKV